MIALHGSRPELVQNASAESQCTAIQSLERTANKHHFPATHRAPQSGTTKRDCRIEQNAANMETWHGRPLQGSTAAPVCFAMPFCHEIVILYCFCIGTVWLSAVPFCSASVVLAFSVDVQRLPACSSTAVNQ